jgi:hypothetical protein
MRRPPPLIFIRPHPASFQTMFVEKSVNHVEDLGLLCRREPAMPAARSSL